MTHKVLLGPDEFKLTLSRLCYELIENHNSFSDTVIIGIQPRGAYVANRLAKQLKDITQQNITSGTLDITFYRDDFRHQAEPLAAYDTNIDFLIEDKKVVLVDDVLYTGRTIRAAMEALLQFGRPASVELLAFVDRRYSRHLPIQPDYVGRVVDTIQSQKVKVEWVENEGTDHR
ncbi:MAG: bifunctional pyr operon transcriptional regulator/uracil phosphoribosyltransferase PyrR [Sphingobacteriales bacterium JAD_PAG50586_3]|nr:MAG: bifunctional pyr operon transcriptional regulator/uracil phosphoribosyltransferase PyrR [Sphingobacteriales bacterium JAD_PAG50586_3]